VALPGFLLLNSNQMRKEHQIGSGGCAVIYQGTLLDQNIIEKSGEEQVAVKDMIDNPKCSKEENQIQFQQEVSILWRCSSVPNVLRLIGYSNNPRCLITKLYETDLYKLIHTQTMEMTPMMNLSLASDIANGMRAIHGFGIVHRDLKSPNIFLETLRINGRAFLRAVIGDFGLARISNEFVVDIQKTINVQGMSPRYTAPEVFVRLRSNITSEIWEDKQADIYSYAIILWEILTRKKPWNNCHDVNELEKKVVSGIREIIPDSFMRGNQTMVFLQQLTVRCWAQKPTERPSFNEIAEKLEILKSSIY